jgi:hypothetical protein
MKLYQALLLSLVASTGARAMVPALHIGTTQNYFDRWTVREISGGEIVSGKPTFIPVNDWGHSPAITIPFTDNDGFWEARRTFVIPPGATNVRLHISRIGVDDRCVIKLNDVIITSAATTAKGAGFMQFSDPGENHPYSFDYVAGPVDFTGTANFRTGVNVISVIVNNTEDGKDGTITPFGPTNFGMVGEVTYDLP